MSSVAELGPLLGAGRTAEVYAWGNSQILKLYRPEMPEKWVWHEAQVARVVAEAGLAAPGVGDVIEFRGRRGIIYERITGPSMLDDLARRPWRVARSARRFAEIQAAMHACARPELSGQREALLRGIELAPALPAGTRRRTLDAVAGFPDGDAVCHGDYHPDNVIMSPRGPIVIDWMTATHGNPVADVARTVLVFRVGVLPEGMRPAKRLVTELFRRAFLAAYLNSYRRLRPAPDAEIETWLPVLAAARLSEGIAAEEASLLRFAETTGEAH